MSRIRIENLRYTVTVDDAFTVLEGATIEIEDGVITSIEEKAPEARSSPRPPAGTGSRTERQRGSADGQRPRDAPPGDAAPNDDAAPHDAVDVIDGRGKLAMPGLVNLHTHLPMTLLRGIAEGVDLQGFLEIVWAAEAAVMDPETVELGARLGALESLLGGCTTQLDMYFHHEAAHRGAVAVGSRHVGGPVFFDGPGPDGLDWTQRLAGLAAWPRLLDEIGGPLVPVAAMPHSTYTCSPDHLGEVSRALDHAAYGRNGTGRPTLLHTHVSENLGENADVIGRLSRTPTQILAEAGWFYGQRSNIVLGHGVHLDDADRTTLAAAGATVAHCPGSNLKLASGALPWDAHRAAGVPLGIGTDGCSSSNDLDMWQAMRQAALLARLTSDDPSSAPAEQVLRSATIDGATALGLADLIGSLEVGKRADLVLLDLARPHLTPVHDLAALLVFAAGRADVTDVLVDGEVVVREGRSSRIDPKELLARCRERAAVAARATQS